jgi:tRNA nucleotidyltransferase (CCA-adding enzyme)
MVSNPEILVLKKIVPSKKDIERVERFKEKLLKATASTGMEAIVCGSLGKNTWLKGDHDIDLFVMFNKDVPREELEEKGLRIGRRIAKQMGAKPIIKYAEHPYVRFAKNSYDVDVVPSYRIKMGEHIKSAVDRSTLHVQFVNDNLKEKQQNEVRLLKQFMKGINVYGSDAKNLGFSGYVCELLVMEYSSFRGVLKAAVKWKAGQHIYGKGKKFKAPLVVIDPVDKNRNAAAVVSADNFFRFKKASKNYLKNPQADFFFSKEKNLTKTEEKQIAKRGTKLICIKFPKPDELDDIIVPQIRRLGGRLETLVSEFNLLRKLVHSDRYVYILLELEIAQLPDVEKMSGPPIYSRQSENFIKKYSKAFVFLERERWCAEKQRLHRTPEDKLKWFIKTAGRDEGVPSKLVKNFRKAKLVDWRQKELKSVLKRVYFENLVCL